MSEVDSESPRPPPVGLEIGVGGSEPSEVVGRRSVKRVCLRLVLRFGRRVRITTELDWSSGSESDIKSIAGISSAGPSGLAGWPEVSYPRFASTSTTLSILPKKN